MKKKTHGLTILMLKDDIKDAKSAIKEPGNVTSVEVTLGTASSP